MSDDKKYYYLKLKDNFYNTEDIKLLESMPNGYEYSSFYLKLCLLSLKGEGKLLYKNRIPYKPEMLATITGHKIEVIEYAIPLFKELEMLTLLDNGTIFIDDIQNLIGHGSTEAERKKEYRKKIKGLMQLGQCPDVRTPEIEIEKEIEIEIEKEIEKEPQNPEIIGLVGKMFKLIMETTAPTKYKNKAPDLNSWYGDLEKMHRIDGFPLNHISEMIDWVYSQKPQASGFSWGSVILSARNLRDKATKIEAQMSKKWKQQTAEEKYGRL